MPSIPNTPAQRDYWCFISYRHADNKAQGRQWATWLHHALETYEVPEDLVGTSNERGDEIPSRIYPVFRDEEELPADAELSEPINRALRSSRFMVVICSPSAAESQFVEDEIRTFKMLGKSDSVLAMMIRGEPNASEDAGKQRDGIRPDDECFPRSLRHRVNASGCVTGDRTEPVAADFRLEDGTEGWTSPEAYRHALQTAGIARAEIKAKVDAYAQRCGLMKLKIIAGILGVPLGTLTDREKAYQLQQARKRTRSLQRWLAVVSLAMCMAIAAGVFAAMKQQEAQRRYVGLKTFLRNEYVEPGTASSLSEDETKALEEILNEPGVSINYRDKHFGMSLLLKACTLGHSDLARWLILHGADVNVADKAGQTPLMYACANNSDQSNDIVNILIGAGVNPKYKSPVGMTALHMAATQNNVWAIRTLVNAGVDVHEAGPAGWVPMQTAAGGGNFEAIKCLIDLGANVNYVNMKSLDCSTPLFIALCMPPGERWSKDRQIKTIELLIKEGVDLNSKNKKGATALDFAIDHGDMGIVRTLVRNGADLKVEDKNGNRIFDRAVISKNEGLAKALIDGGMDLKSSNSKRYAPIHMASKYGCIGVIKALLEKGVAADFRSPGGWTALMYAAREGQLAAAKLLLSSGAAVNAQTPSGYAPLSLAAWNGHSEIVKLLLDHGVDKNCKDEDGNDALHEAMSGGHIECAEILGSGPCTAYIVVDELQDNAQPTVAGVKAGDIIVGWADWDGTKFSIPAADQISAFKSAVTKSEPLKREISIWRRRENSSLYDVKKFSLEPGLAGIVYHPELIPIEKKTAPPKRPPQNKPQQELEDHALHTTAH